MPVRSPAQQSMYNNIVEMIRRQRPHLEGAVIKTQHPEPWMLQVAAGDESIDLRQGISRLTVQVSRNLVQVEGVVGGSRPGTTIPIQRTSTGYANQVEAAIAFQRLAAEYVGKGYSATPDGPLGRRVLDNQDAVRVTAAMQWEAERQANNRRVRAETDAADAARMLRMAIAIQAGETGELEVPPAAPVATPAPTAAATGKPLLQRLTGKRKLRRNG